MAPICCARSVQWCQRLVCVWVWLRSACSLMDSWAEIRSYRKVYSTVFCDMLNCDYATDFMFAVLSFMMI